MDKLRERFLAYFPQHFFLSASAGEVNEYLKEKKWLQQDEQVESLEKPGEGNMNLVLRARTNQRTFILKQARPWAEKFPDIPAPVERNKVEAAYYRYVNRDPVLKKFSPELLVEDKRNFMIILGDLGDGVDYTDVYNKEKSLSDDEMKDLIKYLNRLHHLDCPDFPYNLAMRELNHEYIFEFPFRENNGLDLDAIQKGLMEASMPFKRDKALKSRIRELGKYYLLEGPVLIHGDYFPGSWLRSSTGLKVIDPEFGFRGYAEFDLGVFYAHMLMAQQKPGLLAYTEKKYIKPPDFDQAMLAGFTGIEILRRLLGVAQLPLSLSLKEKKDLMQSAKEWIMNGKIEFPDK